MGDTVNPDDLRDRPSAIWTRIAPWWDAAIGEGNEFQLQLIMPATDRLLAVRPGQRVLDVACGNGNYARRLARAGADVTAFDVAAPFVDAARRRTTPADGRVAYHLADATDEASVLAVGGSHTFDSAVCSMALMDLPTLDPLLRALKTLLKPAAPFVFSLPHPCFNSAHARMTAELINEDGRLEQIYGVTITRYIQPAADLSSGILNQPEPHYLYHRPLSLLISTFAAHGFTLDALEEPTFPAGGASGKNAFSWKSRPEIPPALVARVRLP
jgi:2-polyprenyl-3-methyl-5-hydroxy-6-metoxy-1,4-benzoquinol methylase